MRKINNFKSINIGDTIIFKDKNISAKWVVKFNSIDDDGRIIGMGYYFGSSKFNEGNRINEINIDSEWFEKLLNTWEVFKPKKSYTYWSIKIAEMLL